MRKNTRLTVAVVSILALVGVLTGINSLAVATCNLNATTSNFSSQISAASAGQTVCLASGNYGTWTGTNKSITITPANGANVTIYFELSTSAGGFTVDGTAGGGTLTIDGARIVGPTSTPRNITVRNSVFTDSLYFDEVYNSNIVFDHNTHDWNAVFSGFYNGKIVIFGNGSDSGVTIKNSTIRNGDLDGVHLSTAAHILNNTFENLCDVGTNHTDNIQFQGAIGGEISGNYIHEPAGCDTQGITSFDSGTVGVVIQNNVIDILRPWGIEFYSDQNSIIRHNTVVWHAPSSYSFNQPTGQIDINRKPADPAGSGTHVYDNVAFDVGFNSGSTGTDDHNVSSQSVAYQGGANPTTHDGFLLAAGSAGKGAASDGSDVGVYAIGAAAPGAPASTGSSGTGGTTTPAAGSAAASSSAAPAATSQKAATTTPSSSTTKSPEKTTAKQPVQKVTNNPATLVKSPSKAVQSVATTLHTSSSRVWAVLAALGALWFIGIIALIKLGLLKPREIMPVCRLALTEVRALLHRT